jgi:hypothetical protein
VDESELLRGPVAGEIAILTKHFFLVVHFFGEMKAFKVGVGPGVVPRIIKGRPFRVGCGCCANQSTGG